MRNKTFAAIIAVFGGSLGLHRFYLKQPMHGFFYLFLTFSAFSFVGLPAAAALGFIDAIMFLLMDQKTFDAKYNKGAQRQTQTRRTRTSRTSRTNQREQRYETRRTKKAPYQRMPRNVSVPKAAKKNPFKITGIKKYKDYEFEEAIADFKKAIEMSPRDVSLHFNLACAYSQTEQTDKSLYHLSKAVAFGFKDFEKIKTHDDLAYVRIQEEFEAFEENGFRIAETKTKKVEEEVEKQDDVLLEQLKRLVALREKGLITEKEYAEARRKLMD